MILQRIPDNYFEIAGTGFGLLASVSIAAQVHAEFTTHVPSTVSSAYAFGFFFIFAYWTVYGLRFKRPALWLTNGIASLMQILLLVAILRK
ncbi:MAG: hypothetical protein HN919_21625 [Verrucomicrobia bacterium]|jgi:hypothetical protein|nr:hypothetical protein [Verrucomicrobiota bacterium]MBT7068911.1 hypothetical protein [Verrucomicrobiota bacterium]MBT7701776.1 hypothetical protein [Verrucomicrobiota bacterium]